MNSNDKRNGLKIQKRDRNCIYMHIRTNRNCKMGRHGTVQWHLLFYNFLQGRLRDLQNLQTFTKTVGLSNQWEI